jgi:hypothetical protein
MCNAVKTVLLHLLALLVFVFSIGCTKKQNEVEGYRVFSYEPGTGKWIIIRKGTFGEVR